MDLVSRSIIDEDELGGCPSNGAERWFERIGAGRGWRGVAEVGFREVA